MNQPQSAAPPQYQYADRPEVSETFADFVQRIQFDGQTLRLEFCVSRLDDHKPGTPVTGKRYPTCRLVPLRGRGGRSDEQDAADHRGAGQSRRAETGRNANAGQRAVGRRP